MCSFCLEFVTDAPKKQRTIYGCPVCKVGFYFNKNCFNYFHEIINFDDIKAQLVDKNMKKSYYRTLEDSMKFNHPKMNVENYKATFEESGNSMTSVSNKNDSTRNNSYVMNGKVGGATRKRNKGKISSKVVRKDYDYLMKDIEKSLEE